jgi:cell division protein FtsN
MLFGLGLGLIVALGVYLRRAEPSAPVSQARVPRSEQASESRSAPAPAAAAEDADDEPRFDFYDILPRYEVVVPEVEEQPARAASPARPIDEPGSYILQAGSFAKLADADRLQASLALLGIESRIQKVTIDDDVFHRVRVGPIRDLAEVNRLRAKMRSARLDPLVMKVPD